MAKVKTKAADNGRKRQQQVEVIKHFEPTWYTLRAAADTEAELPSIVSDEEAPTATRKIGYARFVCYLQCCQMSIISIPHIQRVYYKRYLRRLVDW